MPASPANDGGHAARARLALFTAAWLLDYRAPEGDHFAILLQASSAVLSALCIGSYLSAAHRNTFAIRVPVLASLFFVVFTAGIGLIRGQTIGSIITTAIPLLLFIGGMVLVFEALESSDDPKRVRTLVITLAVLALVIKPFVAYFTGDDDFDLEYARSKLVSGAITIVMSYSITSLFTRPHWRHGAMVALVAAIVAASITRTYVVVAAVIVAVNIFLIIDRDLTCARDSSGCDGGGGSCHGLGSRRGCVTGRVAVLAGAHGVVRRPRV